MENIWSLFNSDCFIFLTNYWENEFLAIRSHFYKNSFPFSNLHCLYNTRHKNTKCSFCTEPQAQVSAPKPTSSELKEWLNLRIHDLDSTWIQIRFLTTTNLRQILQGWRTTHIHLYLSISTMENSCFGHTSRIYQTDQSEWCKVTVLQIRSSARLYYCNSKYCP